MARHRNVRNYAYEEDMYDDVYGHSVEEHDICVSPTTAQQFLYRRSESQHPNLSSFMEEPLDYDEEDNRDEGRDLGAAKDLKTLKLDKVGEAKLLSCMDEFRSILGDHCDEEEAIAAILKHNFDLEKAIDDVLSKGGEQDLKSHNTSINEKDVVTTENISNFGFQSKVAPLQPNKIQNDSRCSNFNNGNKIINTNRGKKFTNPENFQSLKSCVKMSDKFVLQVSSPLASVEKESGPLFRSSSSIGTSSSILLLDELLKAEGTSVEGEHTSQTIPNSSSPLKQLLEMRKSGAIKNPSAQLSEKQLPVQNLKIFQSGLSSPSKPYTKQFGEISDATLLTSIPQNQRSISPLSEIWNKKHSSNIETKKLKSLNTLMETTQEDRRSTSRARAPNIRNLSSLPLSELLGSKQRSENQPPECGRKTQLLGRSLKEKQSLMREGSRYLPLTELTSGGAESSQEMASIVHIPRNDGCSPLSQLLKRKNLSDLTKTGVANTPQNSMSDITKDIDSYTPLACKSPSEKSKQVAGLKDLMMSEAISTEWLEVGNLQPNNGILRELSIDVTDGFRIQPTEVDEEVGSRDSILQFYAIPSTFACTLLVYYEKPDDKLIPSCEGSSCEDVGIVPFNFSTPSPDDVVINKQKNARRRK